MIPETPSDLRRAPVRAVHTHSTQQYYGMLLRHHSAEAQAA